jgi:hypothetical protein
MNSFHKKDTLEDNIYVSLHIYGKNISTEEGSLLRTYTIALKTECTDKGLL